MPNSSQLRRQQPPDPVWADIQLDLDVVLARADAAARAITGKRLWGIDKRVFAADLRRQQRDGAR